MNLGPISDVNIGENKERAIELLGSPESRSKQKFQGNEYEILTYIKSDGLPMGFVTIDMTSSIVAGKAIWIANDRPESDFCSRFEEVG